MATVSLDVTYLIVAGMVIFSMFLGLLYLGMYYYDIKTKYNEMHIRHTAAKKNLPIIRLIDNSGLEAWILGDKDKDYDVKFKKTDKMTAKIDPSRLSKMPATHLSDGTRCYDFSTMYHFAVDKIGASGVLAFFKKVRKEYAQLDKIRDDFVILELLGKSSKDLENDVSIVLKRYDVKKEEMNKTDFINIIEDIRSKMTTRDWGVGNQFISINSAMSRLPFGMFSIDVDQIVETAQMAYATEFGQRDNELLKYGFAAMFVLIGGGVAVYIMSLIGD